MSLKRPYRIYCIILPVLFFTCFEFINDSFAMTLTTKVLIKIFMSLFFTSVGVVGQEMVALSLIPFFDRFGRCKLINQQ